LLVVIRISWLPNSTSTLTGASAPAAGLLSGSKSTVRVSSARTAEAAKLTENIFRAVNIALVNELKIVYDRMGIDVDRKSVV
jgi:3-hydroxyisobutyrate dehydrogenase-like beta-hydroxyacid dehydrogenase